MGSIASCNAGMSVTFSSIKPNHKNSEEEVQKFLKKRKLNIMKPLNKNKLKKEFGKGTSIKIITPYNSYLSANYIL